MRIAKRVTAALSAVVMLGALAACGSGTDGASGDADVEFDENEEVEITFAGWSFDSTPEFQQLADAFMDEYPNVTVTLKSYSADDYDTQLTADLSSGSQPDVFPIKNLQKYYTYAVESGGLAELGDVAAEYEGDDNIDISQYELDGEYYAMPYRQDSWVLFYNKDMFDACGLDYPDETWTWDDYTEVAEELKEKLPDAGYESGTVYPTYLHTTWQSVVQSFALAQSGQEADDTFFAGDYSYLEPYYERALYWQDNDLTLDYNTITSNSVQYQAQFGTQKAAMMPMGTWFAATLITQQESGDADDFNWGIVPIPQNPDTEASDEPVTFGDPTGLAVSSVISGQELAAAKEFVKFCAGPEGSAALAELATTPAYFSDDVADVYFSVDGMPDDDMSRYAWITHVTLPENPVGAGTDTIQSDLKTAHSTIMTETGTYEDAIADATSQLENSGVLNQ